MYRLFIATPILLIAILCSGLLVPKAAFCDGVVTGMVSDQQLLIPISGIEIVVEGTDISTLTDDEGRFALPALADGDYKIVLQSSQHERTVKEVVISGKNVELDIELIAAKGAVVLREVSVSAKREVVATAKQSLKREEIMTAPGAGNDAVRVVQSLPGVANLGIQSYGAGGLVIRGTGAEDSGYYLDGFFLPQLFHFGGLQTVVNSEWIESLDYYAGGYSVMYGEAMGGIVEINTRMPEAEDFAGVVDLTNYSSFALVEGPFGKDSDWSGGASVRRSFIDFILPEFLPDDQAEFTMVPRFYDYQAIVAYKPNTHHTFKFFAFGSDDRMGLASERADEESPTANMSFDMELWFHRPILSWTYTPNPRINNRLGISPRLQKLYFKVFADKYIEFTIKDMELREDFTIDLADWNTLSLGLVLDAYQFDIEADVVQPPKEGDPSGADLFNDVGVVFKETIFTEILIGYIEDTFDIGPFSLTPGLRASTAIYQYEDGSVEGDMSALDPRFFARWRITDSATLKGSAGMYHQYPQGDEMVEPFGTPKIEPEVANSYGGGVEYDFGEGYAMDAQGYYKQMLNLVSGTESGADEPYDNEGIGHVYGAELLVRKALTDRLYGWLSYTYSVSERRNRPGGDWRYFDQDQRHNFILLGSYRIGDAWRVGGKFSYGTGTPFTEIDTAIYNTDTDSYIPIYSEDINVERQDDVHQLDLRVDKVWQYTNWELLTYLDVQNVYFEKQPIGYMYNYDYTEKEAVSFPSFYPTLGVSARW